jgi:hypothetical protein
MYTIQVACICQVLEQSGDMARLSQFIDQLDNTSGGSSNSSSGVAHCTPSPLDSTNLGLSNIGHNYRNAEENNSPHQFTSSLTMTSSHLHRYAAAESVLSSEPVLRAKALVAFRRGQYQLTVDIIESNAFRPNHHDMLQDLWFRSHYAIAEQVCRKNVK